MRLLEAPKETELPWDSKMGTAPGETKQESIVLGLELLSTRPPAGKVRQQHCADVSSYFQ